MNTNMNRTLLKSFFGCLVALVLVIAANAASTVELKLKDGSKWRGEVGSHVQLRYLQQSVEVPLEGKLVKVESLYIVVDGMVAGARKQVTIFKSDIVSMTTIASSGDAPVTDASKPADTAKPVDTTSTSSTKPVKGDPTMPGVFVLPMEGTVGETFRHEEIQKLGEYIDKNYPPGQIIVLRISSNGGSSPETTRIGNVIRDLRTRHRVVAWIEKAISAGCQTAMYCNEIYFMTQGTAGSVTTWNPGSGQAVRGELLDKILEEFVNVAEENGYSRHIALAMKMNEFICTYDKDPTTGEVTFYGDMSGEFKLSDSNSNLCFNASNALHCGFSDGTADTNEELAKLLNLPKWNEIDDYGRKLAKDWQRTCEEANTELPLIFSRLQYKNTSTGDAIVILGTRIQLLQDALRWWDKCRNVCEMVGLPPKDVLEREITELKKQLADIRRAQR